MGTTCLTEHEGKILRNNLITLHNRLEEAQSMRDYLKGYNRSLEDPSPFNAFRFLTVKEHMNRLKGDIRWYKEQIQIVQNRLNSK